MQAQLKYAGVAGGNKNSRWCTTTPEIVPYSIQAAPPLPHEIQFIAHIANLLLAASQPFVGLEVLRLLGYELLRAYEIVLNYPTGA